MEAAQPHPPRRRMIALPDGEMAVLDFGDSARPVDLVFIHANGFNANTYRAILEPLSAGLRIIAPDLRGHGRSTLPADPRGRRSWGDHRDDILALLDALDGPRARLAGHSMGGTVALLAAAAAPARVADLVLLDPVMWGPLGVILAHLPWSQSMAARRAPIAIKAARRRARFDSREDALKAYLGRGAFRSWPDAMVADYVQDGFRDLPEGGVELTCPPEWEASNYTTHAHDPYAALRRFGGPVRILKAQEGSTCRVGEPASFQRRYPAVTVEEVEGGHFFPMEQPQRVRDALAAGPVRASRAA